MAVGERVEFWWVGAWWSSLLDTHTAPALQPTVLYFCCLPLAQQIFIQWLLATECGAMVTLCSFQGQFGSMMLLILFIYRLSGL